MRHGKKRQLGGCATVRMEMYKYMRSYKNETKTMNKKQTKQFVLQLYTKSSPPKVSPSSPLASLGLLQPLDLGSTAQRQLVEELSTLWM